MKQLTKAILLFLIIFVISLFPVKFTFGSQVPIGNFVELNGGYLKTQSSLSYSPEGFAFEGWIKPDSLDGIQTILSIGDMSLRRLHYEIGINGTSLSVVYRYGIGSQRYIVAGNLTENAWNHIAVSIGSVNTSLYINGNQVFSTSGTGSLLPFGDSIVIGRNYTESSRPDDVYTGDMDEVRVSSVSRDVSGLWQTGYYHQSLPSDGNTVALWHFDESRGEEMAVDASINGLSCELIGSDRLVHFYGILPSPTPFSVTRLRWERPVLPTLSFPSRITPRVSIAPLDPEPEPETDPTPTDTRRIPRPTRQVYHRSF